MKKALMSILIVFFLCQLVFLVNNNAVAAEFSQELYQELATNVNEVPHIDLLDFEKVSFPNGMVIYLAEDHELPFVQVFGYIRGGVSQENINNAGISQFMTELMNTGTQNYSEQELDLFRDVNALQFSISSNTDYYSFYGNSLASDQEDLLQLAAEVLMKPKFDAPYYQRIQYNLYQSYQQAKKQENYRASLAFYSNLYGNHPYSFEYNADLLTNNLQILTPEVIEGFYKESIIPNHTILAVIGNIDIETMKEKMEDTFSDWQPVEVMLNTDKVVENEDNYSRIILIDKPDATQARIKMGYLFFDNTFVDRIAYDIANEVLGGGDFESRLMEQLRSELGYVYGISSTTNYDNLAGDFNIETNVKPAKTYETIESVKKIIDDIKAGETSITENEVFEIVNRRNALFPKGFQYKEDVLDSMIYHHELLGRDINYVNQLIDSYNSIDAEEAQQVFTKYTYPEKFMIVIVGKKEDILPQFEEAGLEVEVIDFE